MKLWTKYKLKRRGITAQKPRKSDDQRRLRRALERSRFVKGLIGVSSCAGVVAVILLGQTSYRESLDLYVGQPAPEDVFADVGFPYENKEKTEKLRREAAEKILPRYSVNINKLNTYLRELTNVISPERLPEEKKEDAIRGESGMLDERSPSIISDLNAHDIQALRESKSENGVTKEMDAFINAVAEAVPLLQDEAERRAGRVTEGESGERYRVALNKVLDAKIEEWAMKTYPRDRKMRDVVTRTLRAMCDRSIDYDEEFTLKIKEKKRAQVKPVISIVQPGSKIIERGYEVTPQQMEIYSAYLAEHVALSPLPLKMQQHLYYVLGLGLLIVMFFVVSRRYLRRYQEDVYESSSLLFLIELIILGAMLLSKGIMLIPFGSIQSGWNNIFYYLVVISVPMAAILLTLLLNRRLALYFTVLLSIIIGIMKGFNLSYTIVSAIGGIVAVYSTIGVRRRTQIIRAGATVALANVITIGAIDAIANINIVSAAVAFRVAGGFVTGIVSAFIAASLLPLFEYAFNIVTDISLLELCDLNHPLLRRMFVEAPGTYHHSLMVGNLAETAAEAVNANPLQVRVSAYFHDIGKLKKPEYFSENELYGKSKHDELNPRMSGLIIISHVKDGVHMAVQHKLNKKIVDAIREHHGTGLIYFFYHRAEESKAHGEEIAQEDYRYAGPKPQSKETAILLLADAVEAASRSLDRPTPSRVRNLVREVVNQRIIDGQLDNCDLTFRDLHEIEKRFEHTLNSTFHTRVKYPEREKAGTEDADTGEEQYKEPQD